MGTSGFAGKVVLVTGATSGIGRDTALALAERGAKVAFTGRREDRGRELEREIRGKGGQGLFIHADAGKEEDAERAVRETVRAFGGLHGAFNNAGIEGEMGPVVEASYENFRRVFDVNVWGVLAGMKHEIPAMIASGGGSIVNNSSVAGLLGFAGAGTYVASKHAVSGLTRTAALEFSRQGVRVNAVAPAVIVTEMSERFFGPEEKIDASVVDMHPIGRVGRAREVTGPVLWLLSEESSFVTGQVVAIDGGFTAR